MEPRFGARSSDTEDSESDQDYEEGEGVARSSFEATAFEKAFLSAMKLPFRLAILPITGVCKGYELLRANRFDRLLMADNANELVSSHFPDLRTGQYDPPLHARLRWLAQAAAQGDHNRVALFEKALRLPRVQALLESELSAKPVGKMQLVEKIQAYGQNHPRLQARLIKQVGQSIRRGENWNHFEVVNCNAALREALAERDVAGALDALQGSRLCKSDRRQGNIPERLLMNPHNFEVLSQALGGEDEAKTFIEKMITLEIDRDLKGHAYKDYQAEQRAKYPELFTGPHALAAQNAGDHPWHWKVTTDAALEKVAHELAAMTMREYQERVQFQGRLFHWASRAVPHDELKRRSYENALLFPQVRDLLEECLMVQNAMQAPKGKMPLNRWLDSLKTHSPERVARLQVEISRIETPEAAKSRGQTFQQLSQLFYGRDPALGFMKNMIAASLEEDLEKAVQQAKRPAPSRVGARVGEDTVTASHHPKSRAGRLDSAPEPANCSPADVQRMAQNMAQETIDAYLSRLPRLPKKPLDFWEMDTLTGRIRVRKRYPDSDNLKPKYFGLKQLFTEN